MEAVVQNKKTTRKGVVISKNWFFRAIMYFMIFYILNKNLFDLISFGVLKYLYYGVVVIGSVLGIIESFRKQSRTPFLIAFLVYALIVVANGLLTFDSERFVVGLTEYLSYPIVFFPLLYFSKGFKKTIQIRKLLYSIIIWGALASLLAVFEYITKQSILYGTSVATYKFFDGTESYRAGVFIGSPMILAVVFGSILILSVFFFEARKQGWMVIPIILLLVGIFATGSRGPLLFTFIGVIFEYILLVSNHFARAGKLRIVIALVVFAFIFIVLCVAIDVKFGNPVIDNVISRFASVFNLEEEGNGGRIMIWSYYIGKFFENPIIGYGISATSYKVVNNMSHFIGYFTIIVAESGLLTRLVETGLLGTISYAIFLATSIFYGCRMHQRKGKDRYLNSLNIVITGIMVLFVLEDIILQISNDIFANFIVFMFISLSARLTDIKKREIAVSRKVVANPVVNEIARGAVA